MTTKGKILIVFFTLLIAEFGTTVTAYNPLLTYIIRIKNLIFLPNMFGNFTFNNYQTTIEYINANISINITSNMINKDVDVIIIINRCDNEGINCEHFKTWTVALCRLISEKNQVWSSILSSIHPPLKCSFKAHYQHYEVRNASLEVGPIIHIYPKATEYQWRILTKYHVNNFFLGGFKFDLSFFGYTKRIK